MANIPDFDSFIGIKPKNRRYMLQHKHTNALIGLGPAAGEFMWVSSPIHAETWLQPEVALGWAKHFVHKIFEEGNIQCVYISAIHLAHVKFTEVQLSVGQKGIIINET